MSTFHARMLEAKAAKMTRRNRGESIGNHGIRPLTKAEPAEIDPEPGSWWRLVAETRLAWRHARTGAIEQFRYASHEICGDSLEI
jgi:hypothetical protein